MKRNMKGLLAMVLMLFATVGTYANDGVYYVNGNQLVPIHETNITVAKEVLTISLCDDGYAKVDVQYEFMNHGDAKTVEMGFEASAPYNTEAPINKEGKHPYITDFTVVMNGAPLTYSNAIVLSKYDEECTFEPVDLNKYKPSEDYDHLLYDSNADDMVPFSYAYYFKAHFNKGINKVHHTYRYCLSNGVGRTFELTYWLKPAMRWGNHKIDDFTLRIKAENTAKHFLIEDSLFMSAPFKVIEGKGKVRKNGSFTEIALRNGTVEWHSRNFLPVSDLELSSADIISHEDSYPFGYFYDRSETYNPFWRAFEYDTRIYRNMPYAHRGYVFKDKKLQAYFNKLFWYMPDPSWKASTSDFTPKELEIIKNN